VAAFRAMTCARSNWSLARVQGASALVTQDRLVLGDQKVT
jgi:hypothetical protein